MAKRYWFVGIVVVFAMLGIAVFSYITVSDSLIDSKAAKLNAQKTLPVIKTDVQPFVDFLDLSVTPTKVWWFVERQGGVDTNPRVPGPSDYVLTALLELDPESMDRFISQQDNSTPRKRTYLVKDWMPKELNNLGDNIQTNVYDAGNIARMPYSRGVLLRVIGTPYAILTLTTS